VFQRRNFIAGACAVALGLGAATQAAGAPGAAPGEHQARSEAKVPVLDRSRERFKRSDSSGAGFASPEQFGVSQATLDAIGSCESGGNPAAVSSDGTYRGKYQFDYGTWESAGGSGDPAAAPEAEQDMRAAMLYSRAGTSPWPICG
jgi:soluble lytic murein transglycosylase-like protein